MRTTDWKAGVATVVITPREPMWLAGWAARREPALDAAQDLFCKALALEDAQGNRAVIITADLIAISRDLAASVSAKVQARFGLRRESLLFNDSHTHTGPEVRPDKVPFFEIPAEYAAKIPPYVAELETKMVEVIGKALSNLKPASLRIAKATANFAHNRRPGGGGVDHDVPILEISDPAGKSLAILFGYACHNLVLPPTICRYHGDYAGLAQQFLQEKCPGATALFLTGAAADQNPEPRGDMEIAIQHAKTLAESIKKALAASKREVAGTLRSAYEELPLKFAPLPSAETLAADVASDEAPRRRKAEFLRSAIASGQKFPADYPCPLQVMRLGDELLLIALGGEPVAEYSHRCKSEFSGPLVWVAGYSNDMFGYLPTRRVLQEGGYEGGRALLWSALPAPFTEFAEDEVLNCIRRLVQKVQTKT